MPASLIRLRPIRLVCFSEVAEAIKSHRRIRLFIWDRYPYQGLNGYNNHLNGYLWECKKLKHWSRIGRAEGEYLAVRAARAARDAAVPAQREAYASNEQVTLHIKH